MERRFFTEQSDSNFCYQLLDRMIQDCKYFLMTRSNKHLWAGNPQDQEDAMREVYDLCPVKPEWCTKKQLEEYISMLK